jgi:hypothetical protein
VFANLITYHLHRHTLPAQDTPASAARVAPAYQYILAGNGVLVRAETRFFTALLRIAPGVVRGLPPLRPQFRLKVPRLPAILCELHSHGLLPAYWSATDDADEQGARLYAVIGRLAARPEIRLRVGVNN